MVTFEVAAEDYARFMGRYSEPLAMALVESAGCPDVHAGGRALDVGCGPGAVVGQLVERVGIEQVAAVDPSESFVAAVRARFPGLDVQQASAEHLPFEDGSFAAAYASLVVHFMTDPVGGLREMGRVVRPGGTIAVSVWDFVGGASPLSTFWRAVAEVDPAAPNESGLPGTGPGDLVRLVRQAGLHNPVETRLTVSSAYQDFEEWWEPYSRGVGPAGAHVARLDEVGRSVLRERCRTLVPDRPFQVTASAWAVVAQKAVR